MGFKDLKAAFEREITIPIQTGEDMPVRMYQFWMLRLLFEIAGNLDSLVVSYRELVQLNKEKAGKGNGEKT